MNRHQHGTPETDTNDRRTTNPQQATHLVRIQLENDARHHANWTARAGDIYDGIPETLSAGRPELIREGTITRRDAVRMELGEEIRHHIEEAKAHVFTAGTEEIRGGSPLPGLLSTAVERFISAVRWGEVAEDFMPERFENDPQH